MINSNPDGAPANMDGWRTLTEYETIYVDACTWMSPEIGLFLQNAAPYMKEKGRKFLVSPSVFRELENCATQKYTARAALELIQQNPELVTVEAGESNSSTADRDFVRMFFRYNNKRKQLLVTHDQQLAQDIQNSCNFWKGEGGGTPSTAVMTLWTGGYLISFDEMSRLKEAQARARLKEMVGGRPVYLDSTALGNALAADLLAHIASLQEPDTRVLVLQNSLLPEMEAITTPLLSNAPVAVQVQETDTSLPETAALFGELYLCEENAEADRLVLVTDDVARANELKNRRPRSDRFPFVDFMTINKYGFLSYLKLSDPASTFQPRPRPHASAPAQAHSYAAPTSYVPSYAGASPSALPEKKATSFVPQLIGAIKSEDIEAMCSYIEKGANLRNGIITSLCQNKNNCLSVLIDTAGPGIDPSCFSWWVTSFYSFADPYYLDNDSEQYALMKRLIAKSAPLDGARDAMVQLARIVSLQSAAHERLWNIIKLAIGKGAPSHVFSSSTGETLLEIAERQKNQPMVEFLSSAGVS